MPQKKMSILAEKYMSGGEFHDRVERFSPAEPVPIIDNDNAKKKSFGWRRTVGVIAVAAIFSVLFLAAFKNPSETEAKAELKSKFEEKVNEFLLSEFNNDKSNNVLDQIMAAFAINYVPSIVDSLVQIEVSDYIFFSTFETMLKDDDERKILASGIIVFGKIIPLHSDFNRPE